MKKIFVMLIICRRLENISSCMEMAAQGCSEDVQAVLNEGMVEKVGIFIVLVSLCQN